MVTTCPCRDSTATISAQVMVSALMTATASVTMVTSAMTAGILVGGCCMHIKQYNFGPYYTLGPGVGNHAYPYTIMNAGFGLMCEQLQSVQPFQSVVMSCTGHMAVVWLTKYRDIVQEHYSRA